MSIYINTLNRNRGLAQLYDKNKREKHEGMIWIILKSIMPVIKIKNTKKILYWLTGQELYLRVYKKDQTLCNTYMGGTRHDIRQTPKPDKRTGHTKLFENPE